MRFDAFCFSSKTQKTGYGGIDAKTHLEGDKAVQNKAIIDSTTKKKEFKEEILSLIEAIWTEELF